MAFRELKIQGVAMRTCKLYKKPSAYLGVNHMPLLLVCWMLRMEEEQFRLLISIGNL